MGQPSEGVYSDTLNKIRELPEEYEKLQPNRSNPLLNGDAATP